LCEKSAAISVVQKIYGIFGIQLSPNLDRWSRVYPDLKNLPGDMLHHFKKIEKKNEK
tara:strand:+ start:360 stop:530 length:171 start_codon:yes stop_codon:yes gene_type:complete